MKKLLIGLALILSAFVVQAGDSVNINVADAEVIAQTIKGIGLAKATAIVKYREDYGPYKSVDDLLDVKGIGEKTLEKIRAQVTLSDPEPIVK